MDSPARGKLFGSKFSFDDFAGACKRSGLAALAALLVFQCALPGEASVTKQVVRIGDRQAAISANVWCDPEAPRRAILIGLHGGVQYGGNFTALGEKLAPQGIAVYSLDLRGHGQCLIDSKQRPRLDYEQSTKDVVALTEHLRATNPKVPIFCVGESLGASVALKAQAAKPKLFDGLILASVGMRPVLSKHIGATLKNIGLGFGTLGSTIDLTPHVRVISDDPRSCLEMIDDPLCRKKLSVAEMLHALNYMHTAHCLVPHMDPDVPVLVIQGLEDRIIHASATAALFEKLSSHDKSLVTFPECGHLLVTTNFLKPNVVSTVQNWVFGHSNDNPLALTAVKEVSD